MKRKGWVVRIRKELSIRERSRFLDALR